MSSEILDERIIDRTERGWSQRQIAEELGCSHEAVRGRLARLGLLSPPPPPPLPPGAITTAAQLRERLAADRARGYGFRMAWQRALADCSPLLRRALLGQRRVWAAAYNRAEPVGPDMAGVLPMLTHGAPARQ